MRRTKKFQRTPGSRANLKRHTKGVLNGLETKWLGVLKERMASGEIQDILPHESMRLAIGEKCSYAPDFPVVSGDGELVFYETKGFWTPEARVKMKAVATRYPWFVFVGVQWKKKQWVYEQFSGGGE